MQNSSPVEPYSLLLRDGGEIGNVVFAEDMATRPSQTRVQCGIFVEHGAVLGVDVDEVEGAWMTLVEALAATCARKRRRTACFKRDGRGRRRMGVGGQRMGGRVGAVRQGVWGASGW